MTTTSATLTQQATCSADVLFQQVGGEAVLLDLVSEQYFGLDPVGTRIWQLLGETASLQHIHERLCAEYDADPQRIQGDLLTLVEQLASVGLVKVA